VTPRLARIVSRGLLGVALATTVLTTVVAFATFDRAQAGQIVVVPADRTAAVAEIAATLDENCGYPQGIGTLLDSGSIADPALGGAPSAYCTLLLRQAEGATFLSSTNLGGLATTIALGLLWLVTGMIIVTRQPRNVAGWVLHLVGLALMLQFLCSALVFAGIKAAPGSIPLVGVLALVAEHAFTVVFLLPLLWLYFPDGRPPSPRWRWPVRIYLGGVGLAFGATVLSPGPLNNLVDLGIIYLNPLGVPALFDVSGLLQAIGVLTALGITVATVFAVRGRYKRARGVERQQLRWLRFVTTVSIGSVAIMFVGGVTIETLLGPGSSLEWWWPAWFAVGALAAAVGIPATYLVAILRHGLWGLDVIIKKAVQYAVVIGAMAVAVGVAVVAIPTLILGAGATIDFWEVGVTAILLTAAFTWIRGPARRIAARIVYGRRASPYEVLSDFGARAGGAYSMDDVLPQMAQLVADATGARRVDVWLRTGDVLHPEAGYPADAPLPSMRPAAGGPLPGEFLVEVQHQGHALGAITVVQPPDDPLTPDRESLVRDVAAQAGLVLRNVGLLAELRASRQRLVAAQDEERRKIERNLHDGAQQQLVALGLQLRAARTLIDRDPAKAGDMLDRISQVAAEALDDLRDLARGIYPPLLADQGLAAALEAQARKAAVETTVHADGLGRYSQEAEATVYFCALEALNNVAKYAGATQASITLGHQGGWVSFAVTDDGAGFDTSQTSYGTGLQGMADRLEAIGGHLEVTSAPGEGTTVAGRVPVPVESTATPEPVPSETGG